MNEHHDVDIVDDELSPAMPERRKVLASLIGGFAMPLLPHVPWATNSGVVATPPQRHAAHGASCGDFTFGITDPMNVMKAAMAVGINAIPLVGGMLGALFELVWPNSAATIWDEIKENVAKMVSEAIENEMLRQRSLQLSGMRQVLADHLNRIDGYLESHSEIAHSRLVASVDTTGKLFKYNAELFKNDGSLALHTRCQLLPLYAQLANLHLVFLRDMAVNAVAYGFDEHGAAVLLKDFHDALNGHMAYVDAVLPPLFAGLHDEYEANRDRIRSDSSNGFGDHGWSATGAWESKKAENNMRNLLIVCVDDYRRLWPSMEPGAAPAPELDRQLWFGPYGVPDCRDLGLIPIHHSQLPPNRPDKEWGKEWIFDRKPDVAMPPPNPGGPIRHVGVPQISVEKRNKWRFPRNFEVYREGDGKPVLPNTWGFSLAAQDGGPVIGVRVDRALYISRGITKNCATGYLVSAIHFKRGNNQVMSVGSSDFTGREIKGHEGEDAPVPKGHVLHEIHQCSTVRKLYEHIGEKGAESVGSVMFSFKLADPALHAANQRLLDLVATTSPRKLSTNDLVDMELRLENANPQTVSPSKRASVRSRLEHEMELEHLEEDRAAFWRRIKAIAGGKD